MSLAEPAARKGDADSGEISTFGWDTAFAVRIENVNAAIAARSMSPPSFSYTQPGDDKVYCSGEFDNWRLTRGGDGDGVNVELPFKNVKGQMKLGDGYQPYTCSAASIIVTVRLHFIDVATNRKHLKVRPTATSQDVPVIELYSVDFSQGSVQPPGAVYALQAGLLAWCEANLGVFEYVFSIVDINDDADKGAWSFLKPTSVSYAYVDGPTDHDAFLGVLAMTLGENPGTYQQTLDARIVQGNEEGAFCISRALLLKNLILPGLQGLWPKLQTSQLTISEDSILLKPKETVELPQVTHQDETYTPKLKQFSLIIEGSEVTVDAYTETDVQDGVTAWCRDISRYTILKGTNKSGQTTLAYKKLPSPDPSHGHYIAEWVEITDAVIAIVLAVAVAALVVLTGGAAGVVIAVIGALIVGLVSMSPQINGLIENDDAPAIDLLAANIVAPIVWTDSKEFTIDAVELSGSIRLGGALGFGSAPTG